MTSWVEGSPASAPTLIDSVLSSPIILRDKFFKSIIIVAGSGGNTHAFKVVPPWPLTASCHLISTEMVSLLTSAASLANFKRSFETSSR